MLSVSLHGKSNDIDRSLLFGTVTVIDDDSNSFAVTFNSGMPPKRNRFLKISKSQNAGPAPSRPPSFVHQSTSEPSTAIPSIRPSAVTQKGANAPPSAHAVPSTSQVTSSSTSGNRLNLAPPNTGSKVKEVANVAWEGLKTSLVLLNESSGCLPPLKAAVGSLVALIDAVEVSETNLPLSSRGTYSAT